jgi:hypothetical protein
LTGHFPTVARSNDHTVAGTVEVTSEKEVVRGVVAANADAFLVRDGRIATLPLPQDLVGTRWVLTPGTAEQLPALVALTPCDPGDAEKSLPPGAYGLYARVVLNQDDGSSLEAIGGPWPLVLR